MSQAWKLVEAEPIVPPKPALDSNSKQDSWNKNRRGQPGGRGSAGRKQFNGKRDGNANRGKRYHDDAYYGGIYIPDTPESRTYYARVAVYNIEMLFTIENLCRDTFLRSYMDEAGYIPIPFICNYISIFGANYPDIISILQESPTLEVDVTNETVRLKENWQMWLMPNGEGGMGLPLYLKQPLPPMADPSGEYFYDYQTGIYYDVNQWYGGENGEGEYPYYEEPYSDVNGIPQYVDQDGQPLPTPPEHTEGYDPESQPVGQDQDLKDLDVQNGEIPDNSPNNPDVNKLQESPVVTDNDVHSASSVNN